MKCSALNLDFNGVRIDPYLQGVLHTIASNLGTLLKTCDFCYCRLIYSVSQKKYPPLRFSDIFPKRLGIFSRNFTHVLYVPIYATVHIFIQLPTTLTKLRHIKCDHPANFYISLEL